jgi:peptidoglycan/LPS O-acetylase OafA/YrhL
MPGVEGLRACAAAAVLIQHCWMLDGDPRVGAGTKAENIFLNLSLGVTLFFALSGFLLYRPFAAAIARGSARPAIRSYLRNRALRILPAYWVILLASALVLQTAIQRDASGHMVIGSLTDPVGLLKAALLLQDYERSSLLTGIGPAWSLAVEAVFYLLLPLLVLGAARLARDADTRARRSLVLLAPPLLLLLIGLSGKLVAGVILPASPGDGYDADWHSVVERSFWAQADLFAFGMIAAVVHTEVVDGRLPLPRGWRPAALALALAIFVPCAVTLDSGQLGYLPQNTAVALAAALVLAAATFPRDGARMPLLQRGLETRAMVAIGLVSYSVFLWNEPVVRWLTDHGAMRDGWAGLAWNLTVTAAVVGFLSWLTYRLVELPALRRKRRGVHVQPPVPAAQLEAAP